MRQRRSTTTRRLTRGKLARAAMDERLLQRVELAAPGLRLQSVSWDEYWGAAGQDAAPALTRLHRSWQAVASGVFTSVQADEYGHAYDGVLRQARVLADARSARGIELLRYVVAFETFQITTTDQHDGGCAATFSSRHPLLAAKVLGRAPSGRSLRSLPIIAASAEGRMQLFFYYRQHSLPAAIPTSLLVSARGQQFPSGGVYGASHDCARR